MAILEKITVFKGDSTLVKELTIVGHPDLSSADWVGKKAVRVDLDTSPVISATMVKDAGNTMFLGYLEPTEVDGLAVGEYIVIFEVTNVVILPKFRKELHYKLKVEQHGIDTV